MVRLSQEGVSLDLPAFAQGQGRIEIDPVGESGEFELARATADWQVETDASWIQVLPESGKAFNVDPNQAEPAPAQKVRWTALSNPSATQTRTAHITFRAGQHVGLTIEAVQGPRIPSLHIYGDANGLMPLGEVNVLSPAVDSTSFFVKANMAWTGSAHADWIQFNPASGHDPGAGRSGPQSRCSKT